MSSLDELMSKDRQNRPKSDAVACLCKKLCVDVGDLVKAIDSSSRISHVSAQPDGCTVLRVSASCEKSNDLKTSIKIRWPFSSVCMVENVSEGTLDVQIIFPSDEDAWGMAYDRACSHVASQILRGTYKASVIAFLIAFVAMLAMHVPWKPQDETNHGIS